MIEHGTYLFITLIFGIELIFHISILVVKVMFWSKRRSEYFHIKKHFHEYYIYRKIQLQRRNMPHFKAFGMIELQYEITIW